MDSCENSAYSHQGQLFYYTVWALILAVLLCPLTRRGNLLLASCLDYSCCLSNLCFSRFGRVLVRLWLQAPRGSAMSYHLSTIMFFNQAVGVFRSLWGFCSLIMNTWYWFAYHRFLGFSVVQTHWFFEFQGFSHGMNPWYGSQWNCRWYRNKRVLFT